MGIEDRIGEVAAAYLGPGERVQAVVRARSSAPGSGGRLNRALVVTSQRIFVLAVYGIRPKALEVIAELPRSTPLGWGLAPQSGPYLLNIVADEPLWVPPESFSAIGQADALRPDPPPGARAPDAPQRLTDCTTPEPGDMFGPQISSSMPPMNATAGHADTSTPSAPPGGLNEDEP